VFLSHVGEVFWAAEYAKHNNGPLSRAAVGTATEPKEIHSEG